MHAVEFILYVADQARARDFYARVLAAEPVFDVPGMTEFDLGSATLGLMPRSIWRTCYRGSEFTPVAVSDARFTWLRRRRGGPGAGENLAGGTLLDGLQERTWGERVAYVLDPDGRNWPWRRHSRVDSRLRGFRGTCRPRERGLRVLRFAGESAQLTIGRAVSVDGDRRFEPAWQPSGWVRVPHACGVVWSASNARTEREDLHRLGPMTGPTVGLELGEPHPRWLGQVLHDRGEDLCRSGSRRARWWLGWQLVTAC